MNYRPNSKQEVVIPVSSTPSLTQGHCLGNWKEALGGGVTFSSAPTLSTSPDSLFSGCEIRHAASSCGSPHLRFLGVGGGAVAPAAVTLLSDPWVTALMHTGELSNPTGRLSSHFPVLGSFWWVSFLDLWPIISSPSADCKLLIPCVNPCQFKISPLQRAC